MVDLIRTLHPRATERLAKLWNEVIRVHSMPLLCAYSLAGASDNALSDGLGLWRCHSHASL